MIDIHWDSKYEIGHPRIDHEHQVFVDLIRSVSVEADGKGSEERAGRLLSEVKKYAEFHFVSEENIMLDAGYPDYEAHRREHAVLLAELDDRLHRFRCGELALEAIVEFMFNWFALHTTREDRKIAEFLSAGAGRH
jgi:hemerythrin